MPYGQGQLLGAGISPQLFLQDYSGFARAGEIQGQAMQQVGAQIGDVIKKRKEEQSQLEKEIKMADSIAGVIEKTMPDIAPDVTTLRATINDRNVPVNQRHGAAQSIMEVLNLGVMGKKMQMEQARFELDQMNTISSMNSRNVQTNAMTDELEDARRRRVVDAKTRTAVGPALLQQVIGMVPEPIGKSIDISQYTPDQQFELANALTQLVPKGTPPPETKEFAVPGGKMQFQWDSAAGAWGPVQTTVQPGSFVDFIKSVEGFNPKAYSDSGQTSIGYGTKARYPGEKITREEAGARLAEELSGHAARVDKAIADSGVSFNENERNALVSFDFNTGAGPSVISRFANDKGALVAKMAEYKHSDKKAKDGLLTGRRQKEIAMFTAPPATPVGFTPAGSEMTVRDQIAVEEFNQKQNAAKDAAATTVEKTQYTIELLDQLKNHEGFTRLFGVTWMPTWMPGTSGADAKTLFENIDARGFMEAIKDMKGMGALSNAEGEKASAALIGLNPRMSENAARKKIDEVKEYLQKGLDRMKSGQLVTGDGSPRPAAPTPRDSQASATSRLRGLPRQ